MRLRATVEYDGTDFAGFQVQAHRGGPARTVQAEIERALAAATGTIARVVGAGRTDAGVHASGQVVHFDCEAPLARDPVRLTMALNAHLPPDVVIRDLELAPDEFHARFSATSRTYRYRIVNAPYPSPLLRRYAYHVRAPLSTERMQAAAQALLGEHDFVAFAAQQGQASTVRRVLAANVTSCWSSGPFIWHTHEARRVADGGDGPPLSGAVVRVVDIEIEANAFLRHMMRRIAGTLVRVGAGRLAPTDLPAIIDSRQKRLAGPTAPAHGLFLERVTYERRDGRNPMDDRCAGRPSP